jgi:(E)-4-hydroxy-3-methylbut-2-enyl-diphosphate synthase
MEKIINILGYRRKITREVSIGETALGGSNPIRIQTMTTTNTNSIDETVEQSIRSIEAGADYIRITTQGKREAQSLALIKEKIRQRGYRTPIIADIHFNPAAALEAAKYADKIRINPGNYADKSRSSASSITDIEYEQELTRVEDRFIDLLNQCKQYEVAIRIGVNQGSLSKRIMNRYGDTPVGMAHSAMEFLRICRKHNYHNLVVSMKSSNTRVMVQATRYLVKFMQAEGMDYPLHLGVTEAGEGEDGRIKSAVGISALLIDGIGDTIRVSLTEEPENEIPVAKTLVNFFESWESHCCPVRPNAIAINPFEFNRRETLSIVKIGGNNHPVVVADLSQGGEITLEMLKLWGWTFQQNNNKWQAADNAADYILVGNSLVSRIPTPIGLPLVGNDKCCAIKLVNKETFLKSETYDNPFFLDIGIEEVDKELMDKLSNSKKAVLLLSGIPYQFHSIRNTILYLVENNIKNPLVFALRINPSSIESFLILSSAVAGPIFLDGLADGIMLSNSTDIGHKVIRETSFGILQASRVRISKTEFISCPGCGRTLFNLNETLRKVKERTSHLKGLKIGVMGCIVNGPGEMADADYGYVGSGHGLVTLYRRKEVVKRNIPENQAVDELIALIKNNADWVDR